jgi:uncharacterized protein YciW
METDIIAMLAGPKAATVLAHRAELVAASLRNQQAVIAPADPGGLPPAARLFLASRIARLNGDEALAAYYAGGAAPPDDPRWPAILRHVDLVTTRPKDARRADIAGLRDAGVTEPDIVRLSQLIAFVNYQARVIAGLRLIGDAA